MTVAGRKQSRRLRLHGEANFNDLRVVQLHSDDPSVMGIRNDDIVL